MLYFGNRLVLGEPKRVEPAPAPRTALSRPHAGAALAATAAQRLRLSVPAHNGPTEASIAAAVPKWNEFSRRLFTDEHPQRIS
jgi:hypothetical protein